MVQERNVHRDIIAAVEETAAVEPEPASAVTSDEDLFEDALF
jgi:hypothetical protein